MALNNHPFLVHLQTAHTNPLDYINTTWGSVGFAQKCPTEGYILIWYFEHILLLLHLPESICTSTSVKTVYFCHLWSTNCSAAAVFLQLHLDTEGWLHRLKHRWVHGDAVLRCEPEKTWNRVLWLFLPRQQHLLWVLCKFFFKWQLMLRRVAGYWGDIWSSGLFLHLP